MDIKEQVRHFIKTNFYVPEATPLGDDTGLLDQGIVDSTGVLEVVNFLEEKFGIQVDDSEMTPSNLDSIASIAQFIERKRG